MKNKNKKEEARRRKFVENCVEHLRKNMFMEDWDFRYEQAEEDSKGPDADSTVAASINTSYMYKSACITIYPFFWSKHLDDEDRAKTLVHELLHCLVDEITELARNSMSGKSVTREQLQIANERTTTNLTAIVHRLLGKTK